MGFKTLSSAIAHVIMNYHAYRTEAPFLDAGNADANASLEHLLNCSVDEIDPILEAKINEATTGNNSCRRTLLQYMHFGLSLSEKARVIEDDPDEQELLKIQLIAFIQNLQRLFVFTPANLFITDTLLIPLDKEQNLSIYKLNSPAAQAYKLTQVLFSTIGLSPSSTENSDAEIQQYISDLFLFKKNQTLSQENITLQESIETITQYINTLENQVAQLSRIKTPTASQSQSMQQTQDTNASTDKLAKSWEFITDESSVASEAEVKNKQLLAQNQKLTQTYEEKKQHCIILESTLTTLQNKPEVKFEPSTLNTPEVYFGLSRRKTTLKPVTTEQPMRRDISEATDKNTLRSFSSPLNSSRFSLFGLLAKSLDLNHGFSDSASSDSASSDYSNSDSTSSESSHHLEKNNKFN